MIKRTRKHQVNMFIRQVKNMKRTLEDGMESACFVGACEERDHCLFIIDSMLSMDNGMKKYLRDKITGKSILEVLGYEKAGASK
jgi:hypothetical protein